MCNDVTASCAHVQLTSKSVTTVHYSFFSVVNKALSLREKNLIAFTFAHSTGQHAAVFLTRWGFRSPSPTFGSGHIVHIGTSFGQAFIWSLDWLSL